MSNPLMNRLNSPNTPIGLSQPIPGGSTSPFYNVTPQQPATSVTNPYAQGPSPQPGGFQIQYNQVEYSNFYGTHNHTP